MLKTTERRVKTIKMERKICMLLVVLCSLLFSDKGFCLKDPHKYQPDKDWKPYPEEKADPYKTRKKKKKTTKKAVSSNKDEKNKIDTNAKDSKIKIAKRNYNVGIKGGMVFSYVSSEVFTFDRQIDGSFYLANDIRLYDSFFVEIDFGYHVATFNSVDSFYKIEYFTIPIIFKYYFSKFFLDPNILEFWAGVGLELRFKLGDNGFDWQVQPRDYDQGIVFALGLRNKIYGGLYITFDFRFYLGLAAAFESTSDDKGHLREFELLFGVSYDIF